MTDWHASLFTGLFTRFGAMPARPHDPAFALSSGEAASWLPHHETSTASGIGMDQTAADGACVGEAIERLQCGPLPDGQALPDRLHRGAPEGQPIKAAPLKA